MKKWNQWQLIDEGYRIENAKITNVSLNMENHGCLCLDLALEWDGCGCVYGGYVLGKERMMIFLMDPQKDAKRLCELWMW